MSAEPFFPFTVPLPHTLFSKIAGKGPDIACKIDLEITSPDEGVVKAYEVLTSGLHSGLRGALVKTIPLAGINDHISYVISERAAALADAEIAEEDRQAFLARKRIREARILRDAGINPVATPIKPDQSQVFLHGVLTLAGDELDMLASINDLEKRGTGESDADYRNRLVASHFGLTTETLQLLWASLDTWQQDAIASVITKTP